MELNISSEQPVRSHINRIEQSDWISGMIVAVISAAGLLYIAISLVVYGARTGKWKQTTKNNRNLNPRRIYVVALISVLAALLRMVIQIFSFNYLYNEVCFNNCHLPCEFDDAAFLLMGVSTLLFLWLRQRSFYLHPSLSFLNKRLLVRVLNIASISTIFGIVAFAFMWIYLDIHTTSNTYVCELKPLTTAEFLPWIMISILILICQCALLALIIYPLTKQGNAGKGKVRNFVTRISIVAAVCTVTDFLSLGVSYLVAQSNNRAISVSTIVDINIDANLISVILSFECWKEMLTWNATKKEERSSNVSVSGSSYVWRSSYTWAGCLISYAVKQYHKSWLFIAGMCIMPICCFCEQLHRTATLLGTVFPYQIKRKTAPVSSHKMSIRL